MTLADMIIESNGKRILVVHRYFWPQQYPYALLLKDIVDELCQHFDFEILSTGTHLEEAQRQAWVSGGEIKKITTLRLGTEKKASIFVKLLNSIYYSIWLFFKVLGSKADVVQVATTPPILTACLVRIASGISKKRYIYHCQDIYPEALLYAEKPLPQFLIKILKRIDTRTVQKASKVVVLSKDMKASLLARDPQLNNISIINNAYLGTAPQISPESRIDDKIKIVFAGSLGRFQNLENLITAFGQIENSEALDVTIIGDGIMKSKLERMCTDLRLKNVQFTGQLPLEEVQPYLLNSDFGIVSVTSGIISVAYPSKMATYLSCGLKIMALVEPDSEMSEYVRAKDIGLVADGTSVRDISRMFERLIHQAGQLNLIGKAEIQNIAMRDFGKETIHNKWQALYEQA